MIEIGCKNNSQINFDSNFDVDIPRPYLRKSLTNELLYGISNNTVPPHFQF